MYIDNLVFEEADFVYRNSSEFTEEIIREIPRELINSLDRGTEGFFEQFKQSMPTLYRVLIENVNHVYLMENRCIYITLNNPRKEIQHYRWGFQCINKLITAEIPLESETLKTTIEKEYLSCIPPELHCFYINTEGMNITDERAIVGFDLPLDTGSWFELDEYFIGQRTEYKISKRDIKALYKEFVNAELRILFEGSLGDIVFFNFSAKDKKIYHIKNFDLPNYQLIKNAPQVLDSYFANAVLGFPHHIGLR